MTPSYSERMRERHHGTGEGFAVDLGKQGTFWSRGWKGCPMCERPIHARFTMYPFETRANGMVTRGWRCVP